MLHRPNHDTAVIAAAHLAFDRDWRGAFASDATGRCISVSLVPHFLRHQMEQKDHYGRQNIPDQ